MSNASLYINSKGYPVTRHSYSGSSDFQFCPRKYELGRIIGWQEREQRAALPFGNAIEAAVRHHHENGNGGAERFDREWARVLADPKNKDMTYSKLEGNAKNLAKIGHEMLQLYALKVKTFPYEETGITFQADRRIEVFPDSDLAGIEFIAYLDMIVTLKDSGEKCIIDCKTSGTKIPDYIVLDPQLQSYSWVEKNPNVGFLWFQKVTRSIEKGSEVCPLRGYKAGVSLVVLKMDKDELGVPAHWVGSEAQSEEMDKKFPPKQKSVSALAAKDDWLQTHAMRVLESDLTKQKVNIRVAKIPLKLSQDRGKAIGNDIIQIHSASSANFFPQQGGIRFPNEKCPSCCMRGICSGDDKIRDELVQLNIPNDFEIVLSEKGSITNDSTEKRISSSLL